ncbi:hypothetical protein [Lactococcus lactis]|jgi:ABC-type arginine/histidine transport system permease subunit|uniref:hypothetical protein n=1 Tax=Lactococcus lactis TaxID=1358 RepID=UPI000A1EA24D|nr:hypothetical protein [Lactococcus lactis]MCC4121094.1 hypothetical protein [Lactococcus lactis]OSP87929.1 hypothetical protein B9W73_03480 [Lactococcus lactis]WEA54971.1 hypothetical protein PWP91_11945 [Lactococcus lactis]WKF72872.1 hypothetical protein QYM42_10905 [Lactococcus lactis]BDH82388.1 hypothetical protein LLL8_20450 [Lactococcus lactis]
METFVFIIMFIAILLIVLSIIISFFIALFLFLFKKKPFWASWGNKLYTIFFDVVIEALNPFHWF